MRALIRSRASALFACAVLVSLLAAIGMHFVRSNATAPGAVAFEVAIAVEGVEFGRKLRRPVAAVRTHDSKPMPSDVRCRWVYAHSDVGFVSTSPNGCTAELFIDPARTRLSRFEHDRWMSIDVIVTRAGKPVGFASTRVRYADVTTTTD